MTAQRSFDYIVIGAGSAGCAIARRLSDDPTVRVLLLESGGPDDNPRIHDPRGFVSLMGSEVDWAYRSVEPHLAGRTILLNRGRVLGGTSATNAMIFIRGHRRDFDHWNYLGNEGWSYRDLLPCFKRSEDNEAGASEHRGVGGPVSVRSYPSYAEPSSAARAFIAAGQELGFRGGPDWDFNTGDTAGSVGYYQFSLTREGRRASTAVAYLHPIRDRSNLEIVTRADVTRLLLAAGRVHGVEYRRAGRVERAFAEAETMLCAGAFNSPKLLMLSGIGPAAELKRHGIPIVHELPGVGCNLQDHLLMPVVFRCRQPQPVPPLLAEAGLLAHTRAGLGAAAPDLQINFNATIPQLLPADCPPLEASFTFITIVARPQSTGYVGLGSADPAAPPAIRENYLACEADLEVQLAAIDLCRRLVATSAFDGLRDAEALPGTDCDDQQLRQYVRTHASTIWHPVGTCKMGRDELAVVDPQLRVHGLSGLRVADASIMPTIVSANPNAAIIAIGEKAVDLIRGGRPAHVAQEIEEPALA
jgi:choline dehydrogenase